MAVEVRLVADHKPLAIRAAPLKVENFDENSLLAFDRHRVFGTKRHPDNCAGPTEDCHHRLSFRGGLDPRGKLILEALERLGYAEGKNLRFEYRSASGKRERLAELAAELVALKPSVILPSGPIAADLPRVYADPEKLRQILLNLLSNAVKYTAQGEIEISAAYRGGILSLAVSDTGIGIEPEAQQHIFEEFSRGRFPDRQEFAGSGLGLAIVKKIVTLLGGEISLESEPGRGSKFSVSLPLQREKALTGGTPAEDKRAVND